MKTVGKTEDVAFENLLRAGVRGAPADRSCPGFDPDQANAYVEHALTGGARARYERHLSDCAPCRTGVVALARMTEAEPSPVQVRAARVADVSILDRVKAALAVLATPRWALAATAVLVVAVSFPLLFSSRKFRAPEEAQPVAGSLSSATSAENGQVEKKERTAAIVRYADAEPDKSGGSERARGENARRTGGGDAEEPAPAAQPPAGEPAASGQTRERQNVPQPQERDEGRQQLARTDDSRAVADQVQAAGPTAPSQSQVGGQQAPQPKDQSASQIAQIDPKKSLSLPESTKDSAHVTALKPGVAGAVEAKAKEEATATIKPEDAQAPKTDRVTSESAGRRGVASPAPKLSMRYRAEGEAAAPGAKLNERRIEGKQFVLIKEFWTDRKYDPEKEVPVVTMVRDSDVYKQLIAKHTGLKKLFAAFAEADRVIVVYKGTVYKLLPPER